MIMLSTNRARPLSINHILKTSNEEQEVGQKKLVEHNALLQAVEMGMSKDAIMEKFNFKSMPELKAAYYDALVALDKVKDVKKGQKSKKVDNKIRINGRGSLVIPKKLIDDLDLGEMDTFKVVKSDAGLVLQTVKKAPKTILRKRNGHSLVRNGSQGSMLPNWYSAYSNLQVILPTKSENDHVIMGLWLNHGAPFSLYIDMIPISNFPL